MLQTSTIIIISALMIIVIALGILAIRGTKVILGKKNHHNEISAATSTVTGSIGTNVNATVNTETGEVIITSTSEEGGTIEEEKLSQFMYVNGRKESIKTITFSNKVYIDTGKDFFYGYTNMTTINNINNLDTSKITSMYSMFYNCNALTNLDLSSFDTRNITDMEYMFRGCSSLTTLDLSSFDTRNVTSMSYMFMECTSLESVNLTSFNIEQVTAIADLFYNCSSLTSLDLSSFGAGDFLNRDTYYGGDTQGLFYGCTKLQEVKFGHGFNPDTIKNWFTGCTSLTTVDFSEGVDFSNLESLAELFKRLI